MLLNISQRYNKQMHPAFKFIINRKARNHAYFLYNSQPKAMLLVRIATLVKALKDGAAVKWLIKRAVADGKRIRS